MTTSSNQFDLSLAHQAMFSVSDASGVQIVCREGSLWVTLDDDVQPDNSVALVDDRTEHQVVVDVTAATTPPQRGA